MRGGYIFEGLYTGDFLDGDRSRIRTGWFQKVKKFSELNAPGRIFGQKNKSQKPSLNID